MLVTHGDKRHRVDIIESISNSSLYPILHFDLTLVQNAISASGLAVYYADLTFKNVALVTPFHSHKPAWNVEAMKSRVATRVDKYSRRGFNILRDLQMSPEPEITSHACFTSSVCPQALRNSEDSGVYFMPFSPMGDEEISSAKSAGCGTIMWRCGGPACKEDGEAFNPCVFHAPNLSLKYSGNTRI